MNRLFHENIAAFGDPQDPEYLYAKEHQLRQQLSLRLFAEVLGDSHHGESLLSIACSTGLIEQTIGQKLGLHIFGIDGAINPLHIARTRGIQAACGDVVDLPFAKESFDHVYAGEIIEHVFETGQFLSEVNRVLKPGGYFVLTTPNLAKLDDRFKFLFGISPRQVAPLHPYLYLHIRPFTHNLLQETLSKFGFEQAKTLTNVIRLDLFGKNILLFTRYLRENFPTLGATLIMRTQKTSTLGPSDS